MRRPAAGICPRPNHRRRRRLAKVGAAACRQSPAARAGSRHLPLVRSLERQAARDLAPFGDRQLLGRRRGGSPRRRSLHRLLGDVEIQPKGLLATEGIISLPLWECPAPALAARSHFFEFAELDAQSDPARRGAFPRRPRLAHEVELGGRYRVALTTAGGLYRYLLGDEVQVVGLPS